MGFGIVKLMDDIKQTLSKWFSQKELKTLEVKANNCPHCDKPTGTLVKLMECDNKIIMCFECLDMYNDSCDKAYLFNCPCCGKEINDYLVVE